MIRETKPFQQLKPPRLRRLALPAVHFNERERDVLNHRHVPEEISLLKDKPKATAELKELSLRLWDRSPFQTNVS